MSLEKAWIRMFFLFFSLYTNKFDHNGTLSDTTTPDQIQLLRNALEISKTGASQADAV